MLVQLILLPNLRHEPKTMINKKNDSEIKCLSPKCYITVLQIANLTTFSHHAWCWELMLYDWFVAWMISYFCWVTVVPRQADNNKIPFVYCFSSWVAFHSFPFNNMSWSGLSCSTHLFKPSSLARAAPVISSEPVPKSVSSVRPRTREQLWRRDENIRAELSAVCAAWCNRITDETEKLETVLHTVGFDLYWGLSTSRKIQKTLSACFKGYKQNQQWHCIIAPPSGSNPNRL